jgi:hypothetical protein
MTTIDLDTERHATCGHKHRSYRAVAKCCWPSPYWILGEGPYATVSRCLRVIWWNHITSRHTIMLHPTEDAAWTALAQINTTGCGQRCSGAGRHEIYVLDTAPLWRPPPDDGSLAEQLARPRKRTDWGPWALDTEAMVLRIEAEGHPLVDYEVDLEWCRDSAQVLDWICQLLHKGRDDYPMIFGLVNALDDVLHPQRNLCSSGKHKTITKTQVAALAYQAAAERAKAVPR